MKIRKAWCLSFKGKLQSDCVFSTKASASDNQADNEKIVRVVIIDENRYDRMLAEIEAASNT